VHLFGFITTKFIRKHGHMNVKFEKMTSRTTQEGKLSGCISGRFIFQIPTETPTILTRLCGVPHFLPASAGIEPQS